MPYVYHSRTHTELISAQEVQAACSSESFIPPYKSKVHHNPEDYSVNANCSENLKTNICLFCIQNDLKQRSVISHSF